MISIQDMDHDIALFLIKHILCWLPISNRSIVKNQPEYDIKLPDKNFTVGGLIEISVARISGFLV